MAETRKGRHRKRTAFTLVELLVVIAILSVLAALLLPALENAVDTARRISCASRMRQQSLAFQYYANDDDGWWPYLKDRQETPRGLWYGNIIQQDLLIEAYTDGDYGTWACPDGRKRDRSPWSDVEDYVTEPGNATNKGAGAGGGGYYYAGLQRQITDNWALDATNPPYEYIADGGILRYLVEPEDSGYAFRSLATEPWYWNIEAAASTKLEASDRPGGVVAGEIAGCYRTYEKTGYTSVAPGGYLRHGGQRDGIFPGGNVMFGDGAVKWAPMPKGFGCWMAGYAGGFVEEFFSLPWIHWSQSTMYTEWVDYQQYYTAY